MVDCVLYTMSKKYTPKAVNSWGEVADWYENMMDNPKSFQSNVILPNLRRTLNLKQSDTVLDLACGQGFFATQFENNCKLYGIDISPELVSLAQKKCKKTKFYVSKAENIDQLKLPLFDKIFTILALQNIKGLDMTIKNVASSMADNGEWSIVLNHPCFRQLRASEWYHSRETNIQYRMLSRYMSNYSEEILMNPSKLNSKKTLTYHRPLQEYIKIAKNNGLYLVNMEEWISHIPQDTDYKDMARKEFPLFSLLVFKKIK
jgi:ubiquinone/menaquinone biosynthesis C-methylase UbiE